MYIICQLSDINQEIRAPTYVPHFQKQNLPLTNMKYLIVSRLPNTFIDIHFVFGIFGALSVYRAISCTLIACFSKAIRA